MARRIQAVNSYSSKDREPSKPIYIPWTTDDRDYDGLEPQYVKVKSNNQAPFFVFLTGNPGITGYPQYNTLVQARRTRRIFPTNIFCLWCIPNCNIRNNVINFLADGLPYTITLTEGFYTPVNLMIALATAMNVAVAALGGWVVTITLQSDTTNVFVISVNAGHTFQFVGGTGTWDEIDTTSKYFLGLIRQTAPVSSMTVFAPGFYTRYFDITSAVLHLDSKTGTIDVDLPANFIYRVYLNSPLPHEINEQIENGIVINVDPSRMLSSIDITLYGPDNTFLYVPTWANNFNFQLKLMGEV